MSKYILLFVILMTLIISRVFSTQSQGGLRFSGNEKLVVSENSIFRKILLTKENRDYPLKVYKVIPWAINFGLCCVILVIYILYAIFYASPIGIAIGVFLDNNIVQLCSIIWSLLVLVYIGIINAL